MSIPPAPCAEHGFHPGQCTISFGVMADPEPFMMAYVRRLDDAGWLHHPHSRIAETRVDLTFFDGELIYERE